MVELRSVCDGPALSSYAVQDKRQEAELDPALLIEEELFGIDDPCMVCGSLSDTLETQYCDGCDKACHVFCAGLDECPDVWYCDACLQDLDVHRALQERRGARSARAPRGQQSRQTRRPARTAAWARVWRSVWDRLNLDLDFPFDDDASSGHPTGAQRRDFQAWQDRLQVASRQGGLNRFRDTAATLLEQPARHAPESQDELRAWNQFDKAREIHNPRPSNRRKRKSTTNSPASPQDGADTSERKLKRPRTRRNHMAADLNNQAESSSHALQRGGEGPSFLTSLLQEVEKQPAPADPVSTDAEDLTDGQQSPLLSSPALSPMPSNHASPRGASVTPPPLTLPRPSSTTPLTSIVRPMLSPITSVSFSPFSPADQGNELRRGRPRVQQSSPTSRGHSPSSPSRNLSYSTKSEIQRMVKTALGSRYRNSEITKDQYTDINRDISRMLYDRVGDAEGLADGKEREKWQKLASDEVEKAVDAIRLQSQI